MSYTERIVNSILRGVFRTICRMDVAELRKLPHRGPAILMTNHTTNIEGPALYLFIQPRPATALGKRELWKHWHTRFIMNLWGIIPLDRGKVDRTALRGAFSALDAGRILGIAPEGTRSPSGTLQKAHPGVAMIASKRAVPIYPVVHWDFQAIGRNIRRMRRTRITFRVGRPFRVRLPEDRALTAGDLRQISDEMMYQLAAILPARMRGEYSDVDHHTPHFLEFLNA